MKLLGIDLEMGNPFDDENGDHTKPEDTFVTEAGLVLWDTDFGCPVDIQSFLIDEGKEVAPEAEEYTGISTKLIQHYGCEPAEVANSILNMMMQCDYMVAHNGNRADKPWLKEFFKRRLPTDWHKDFKPPHWLDTMTDIEYPNNCTARSLTYLAGFHKILNSYGHRAITDTLTMFSIIFNKEHPYDLERIVALSKSPWIRFKGVAPVDVAKNKGPYFRAGTEEYIEMEHWKKKAKKAKFRWDGDASVTGTKQWYKDVKELHVQEGQANFDFQTEALGEVT